MFNSKIDYKCEKCETIFDSKYILETHLNRKTSCIVFYIKISDDKYACKFCNKEYTRSNSIKTHIETCFEKLKYDKEKEIEYLKIAHNIELETKNKEICELKNLNEDYKNIINQHKTENQKLKIELKKSQDLIHKLSSKKSKKKTANSTNINNTTNTNSNNTTNNITNSNNNSNITTNLINIVNFGDESISKLTIKDKKEILENCLFSIVKCVEKVHFNDAIPEQQNSYITGLKSEFGYKFIDGKFIATDIDDLIDTIIENRKEDVRDILENRKDMKISKLTIDKIEDLLDKLDSNEGDLEYIRKEIRLLLFNNKDKVINNKLLQDTDIIV
jgi:hypothetical protein